MRARVAPCVCAVVASMMSVAATTGAGPCGPFLLSAPGGAPFEQFATAVAIDGDTAIVGANAADNAGVDSGAAHIFRWNGADWTLEATLVGADTGPSDLFGVSVAIDGDTVIVGAYGDDDRGPESGSAYIFTRSGSTWTQQAKLLASDGAAVDIFGFAVAIDGDTAIVGSLFDDDRGSESGSAYIFTRNGATWTQQAKLTASDGAVDDRFGQAVAIDGDTALIGAPLDDNLGAESGAAYVFTRTGSTWMQRTRLNAGDGAALDQFGAALALDAGTAIIGALGKGDLGAFAGAAYVYVGAGATWTQQAKLTAADGEPFDQFGYAVSIDGDTALIGAPFDDDQVFDTGAAYTFTRAGAVWSQQAKLTEAKGAASDFLGLTVSLDADMALLGAPYGDGALADTGAASLFQRVDGMWVGVDRKLLAADGAADSFAGVSVAIDGDTAVIGAYGDTVLGVQTGSAYVFVRNGTTWRQQAKLTAPDGAFGDGFGSAVAVEGDTALVGAAFDDDRGLDAGSVYVFTRAGSIWTYQSKITVPDGEPGDSFGDAIAMHGSTAVIGAPFDDDRGAAAGSAYVFTWNGAAWSQQGKLLASDGASNDRFGDSVALDGDTVVIGAWGDDDLAATSGAAYVFTRNASVWTQQAKLLASDGSFTDGLGESVAIKGDTALVGAIAADGAVADAGAVYVFARTGSAWQEQARFFAADGRIAFFGESLAFDGDTAIVGAIFADGATWNTGAAYVFSRTGSAWTQRAKLFDPAGVTSDQFGASVALDAGVALIGAPFDDEAGGFGQGSSWVASVADECLPPFVHNLTSGRIDPTLEDAIDASASGDRLSAAPGAFHAGAPTDLLNRTLSITSRRGVRQPFLNAVTLADGASLSGASGASMTLYGQIDLPPGRSATLRAASLRLGAGADLNLFGGSTLSVQGAATRLEGAMTAFPGSAASLAGPLSVEGELVFFSSTLSGPSLEIDYGGRFVGDGSLATSVVNRAAFLTVDDTLISGSLTNHAGATVTIQIGTLTLLGSLVNNGVIVGDLQTTRGAETQPGDGFSVGGDYTAGPNASLLMSSDLWRIAVGGDFDVAINDNTRYDMAQAELRIGAAAPSDIERMSRDIGPSPDGLDRAQPGHFPIGTLRLAGNTTSLVDTHDNDNLGQAQCEALYVRTLIVDAGATLNTNGCPVYYESLTLNGSVDDPANLIQITSCPADFNGDGAVNGADLGILLGFWTTPGADLNADGTTDGADLGLLLGAWGACP